MEHVVFFPAPDGTPAFRRVPALEDAVRLVEHLRNVEGVAEVSVHPIGAEVPLAFRTYYRVEVPAGPVAVPAQPVGLAPVEEPAPAPEPVAEPVAELVAELAPEPVVEVAPEPVADAVEAASVEVAPAGEPVAVAAAGAAGSNGSNGSNGHRDVASLGFFAT